MKRKKLFHKTTNKAFTLIELLIVIALVILLATLAAPFFSRFLVQSATVDTYNQLLGEFHKAQLYATQSKQDSPWGVYYGSTGGTNRIILYQGSSYATRNTAFDELFAVNPNVTVSGLTDINFAQITGMPNTTATITITGSGNTTRTIQINSQGLVNDAQAGPTGTPIPTPTAGATPTPTLNWYNPSWKYRMAITINPSLVSGNQSNFPVLIKLPSNANLASGAQANGNDILFTDSSGTTKIPHEIESYTNGNGALVAWVNVPALSSTTGTKIYVYYGNPSVPNQQDPTHVWDANYVAVYHLNDNTTNPSVHDSTTNNYSTFDSVNTNSTYTSSGYINGAQTFNGSTYVDLSNPGSAIETGNVTFSFWFTPTTTITSSNPNSMSLMVLSNKCSPTCSTNDLWVYIANATDTCSPGEVGFAMYNNSSVSTDICTTQSTWTGGTWYFVTASYNSSSGMTLYINGSPVASNTFTSRGTILTNTMSLAQNPWGYQYKGSEDEVHISKTARSAGWVLTEYNNQNSPSTFYSLAGQEIY